MNKAPVFNATFIASEDEAKRWLRVSQPGEWAEYHRFSFLDGLERGALGPLFWEAAHPDQARPKNRLLPKFAHPIVVLVQERRNGETSYLAKRIAPPDKKGARQ